MNAVLKRQKRETVSFSVVTGAWITRGKIIFLLPQRKVPRLLLDSLISFRSTSRRLQYHLDRITHSTFDRKLSFAEAIRNTDGWTDEQMLTGQSLRPSLNQTLHACEVHAVDVLQHVQYLLLSFIETERQPAEY